MMSRAIKRLFNKLVWLVKHWLHRPDFHVSKIDESPDEYEPGNLYLVGDEQPWFAEFLCPCGCGELITLKLFGESPSWNIVKNNHDGITLRPSVWRTSGCKSHFFIRNSMVVWVNS